jgi:Cu+-exporting ATPase
VVYSISTGGRPFSDLPDVLNCLKDVGAEIYVASGDSKRSLSVLSAYMGISQDHIYPVSTPRRKEEIILNLKKRCNHVVMVGDGLNDIYALRAADLGVLTTQQDSGPSDDLIEAADMVINNIDELPNLLKGLYI